MRRLALPADLNSCRRHTKRDGLRELARQQLFAIAQGLPHYVHLLCLWAGQEALERDSESITVDDLHGSVTKCIDESQQVIQSQYHTATQTAHSDTIFEEVLLACAIAPTDSLGYFAASDVLDPLARLLHRDVTYATFTGHLKKFSESERGCILKQVGQKRRFRYRFSNPMMKPYVLMRGYSEGRIRYAIDGKP